MKGSIVDTLSFTAPVRPPSVLLYVSRLLYIVSGFGPTDSSCARGMPACAGIPLLSQECRSTQSQRKGTLYLDRYVVMLVS